MASMFQIFNSNREAKRRSALRFMVVSLTKKGTVSRSPWGAVSWKFNAFESLDAATARIGALEALNPGRRFVVVYIDTRLAVSSRLLAGRLPVTS